MKGRKSHIKDTTDFLDKLNDLGQMSEVALLLLYPSIPNAEYLKVLPKQYEKFLQQKVHTEDIVNWQTSYWKNFCFFEFNSKFFQQISGSPIGTKFT